MYRFRTHGLPLLLLLAIVIGLRFSMEAGLRWGIQHAVNKIESKRAVTIHIGKIYSIGLRGVRLQQLKVFPRDLRNPADTLFSGKDISVSIRILPLLFGNINIESLDLKHGRIGLFRYDTYSNYSCLLNGENNDHSADQQTLSNRLFRIFSLIFQGLPHHLHLEDLRIETVRNGVHVSLYSPKLVLQNHHFQSVVFVEQDSSHSALLHRKEIWNVAGKWDKDGHHIEGKMWSNSPKDSLHIPYLDVRYQAKLAFQDMSFQLYFSNFNAGNLEFSTTATLHGLRINYWRLAPQTILPDVITGKIQGSLEDNHLALNDNSFIQVKDLKIHPKFELEKHKEYRLRLEIDEDKLSVADFHAALPKGLFDQLDSIRADGSFGFHFLVDVDMANPDSLQLSAGVVNDHIRLISNGNLNKLNSGFPYTAYLNGVPVRSFYVGESNPKYRRLSEISPILQQAVLHSEDGNFYVHKGFSEKALRKALAFDLKQRRFAKGGSTISMQLVKNVFLDRNKNLFRKAEEAILVWLIENKRITSKSRMFEVYLNLIEWGPRIYGAEEASEFYFGKSCDNLEPDEAIFLASIIPNPRWYAWAFTPEGTLKENRYGHFRIVGGILSRIGIIPPIDPATYVPKVELKGPAKNGLRPVVIPDSVLLQETL